MPRDPQKGTQSASKDKDNKAKEETPEDNQAKNLKPSERLLLIDADFNRKKGRRKAPTSLLVFELDEKILDFLLGKDTEIINKSLFEIVKDGKKPIAISNSQEILDRVSKDLFEMEPILLKTNTAKQLKEEAMGAIISQINEKIIPESSIFIGYLFTQSEMTNDIAFKFGTVVTPDQYFSPVGSIPRERDEPRGVLSNGVKTDPEETLALALNVKTSSNDTNSTSKANNTNNDVNTSADNIANGDQNKRGRRGRVKKPTHYGDDEYEEEANLKELDKPRKTTSSASKALSPQTKEKEVKPARGRKNKAVLKSEEKEIEKNQLKTELMANTASNNNLIEENHTSIPSKKPEKELKRLQEKVGHQLFETFGNLKTDISDSNIADSSSTATGTNTKRKLSFEDEIYDHPENEKYFDKRLFSVNPATGCNYLTSQKIREIRVEPRDSDPPAIQKKLKQTEKKTLLQPNAPIEEQLTIDSDQVLLNYEVKFPFEKTSKTFQIYARDIEMLDPENYINDTLLQFYLKQLQRLIHKEFLDEETQKKVYFFNTYLIDKLKSEATAQGTDVNFEKVYSTVKRWTKDDIFEKEYLIFPNYDGNARHWSLFIVTHPNHFMPTSPDDEIHPRLMYFDSLGSLDYPTTLLITSFLKYEFKNKKADIFNAREDQFRDLDFRHVNQVIVPLQDNYSDCGLYVLEFAERFLTNPDEFLRKIDYDRDFLNSFPLAPLKNKRNDLKKIIFGLSKENPNTLKDYHAERKRRFEYAMAHPETEFIKLEEAEIAAFCAESYGEDYRKLDPKARDIMKMRFYLIKQEKKLLAMNP